MAPADGTTGKVFVTQHHLHQQSTLDKFFKSFEVLNPARLFSGRRIPAVARTIYVNQPLPDDHKNGKGKVLKDKKFPTNQIVTSKYTIITFLPRNLLEQFRRVANIFFLGIAILQFFPKFSTISAGLVILPLLAVLLITALKDGYEDIKRHQSDHRVNHSVAHILNGGPKEEYENHNPMRSKERTFMPAINMNFRRGKRGKKTKGGELDLPKGAKMDPKDADKLGAQPGGSGADAFDSAAEKRRRLEIQANGGQVNKPDDDPEAFDDPAELGWKQTIWEDVKVGDFLKIYEGEQLPADVVICSTSEEEDVCYVETKNLDGETNLKSRHGVPELAHLRTAADCGKARFHIDAEAADVNMFRLNGAVVFPNEENAGDGDGPLVHPVDLQTTLLRGCVIKNTAWVIGIVMFTGEHTKIVLNSGATPSKRSKVERQMNPQVLLNLLLLGVVSMICAIVDHFNEVTWDRQQAYWELYADSSGDNPSINGLVTFANAFITFQNIVPISLYISIEFVRTAQSAFIFWDHTIKYTKNGVTTRTTARSWTLADDLGQIQYVFSDKTGTLTQNAMVFRQCSIGGKVYEDDGIIPENTVVASSTHDEQSSNSSDVPINKPPQDKEKNEANGTPKVVLPKEVLSPFHNSELLRDLDDTESEQSRLLHGFFAVLGLCHTALAAEPTPGVIEYRAQSPDEAALVQAAADVGFIFRGRDRNILKLSTPFSEVPDEYELLQVLEFNSTRKRMSVLIKKLDEDQRIFLLCKGADNVIFERLAASGNAELKTKTDSDLQFFASEGLRTLCLAYKVVSNGEYESWAKEYHHATVQLEDREGKIDEVAAKIENDLILLGATAIEDRLQDGVPETIADLKRAGIKVWVATGDKLETAVAIGYTTNLLTKDTNLIIVREGEHSAYDQIRNALEGFFGEQIVDNAEDGTLRRAESGESRLRSSHQLRRMDTGVTSLVGQDNGTRAGGYSLVIDGGALRQAFSEIETEELLLHLSTQCKTVICCRVSPLQKAQIVRMIKDNLGVMCLAIGDGANDVSMIQAADIGVGISGEEGLQAVNSSDYAIAQFRFLRRLLFVHGHWSYVRNSNMILNFFYKNVIGVGVLFWFQIYCGWSTTYVFEYTYLLFWNVFWSLLPVIVMGLFERDIDADVLMALPELYATGRDGGYFGMGRFLFYILQGVFQSAIIFFFICYSYVTTSARSDGYNVGQYEMSTVMVFGAVMVANFFTGLNIDAWTSWVWAGILIGPGLMWVYTAIYSIIPPSSFFTYAYGNDHYLFRSAEFWFGWPFVIILCLLPQYLYKMWRVNFAPSDIDILRIVRATRPDIDIINDPLLGGRGKDMQEPDEAPPRQSMAPTVPESTDGPFDDPQQIDEDTAPQMRSRPSYSSNRRSLVGGGLAAARGSQIDMSTGTRRQESRGFDFDTEEGGVAMSRMQSRLSEISRRRHNAERQNKLLNTPAKNRTRAGSGSSPFTSLRERAGSIIRPKKKGFFEQTNQMEGEGAPKEPENRSP